MTEAYWLLGWPALSGLSSAMHNAAFAALGLDARYEDRPTPPEGLAETVAALRGGYASGANVTAPHKVAIRAMLDDEDPLVTTLGAVNTIVWTLGGLLGHNTDVAGCEAALAELGRGDGEGRGAVVLGAGGAARAVVHALLKAGYSVTVLNRTSSRAATLAALARRAHPAATLETGPLTPSAIRSAAGEAYLLVNATPVGGPEDPQASLWPAEGIWPPGLAVLDLVSWPAETALVAEARAAGHTAAGGQTMLVHQAAEAFRLWTGREAPVDVMRAAIAGHGG